MSRFKSASKFEISRVVLIQPKGLKATAYLFSLFLWGIKLKIYGG